MTGDFDSSEQIAHRNHLLPITHLPKSQESDWTVVPEASSSTAISPPKEPLDAESP